MRRATVGYVLGMARGKGCAAEMKEKTARCSALLRAGK
jgi:hypothetical protein